MNKDQARNLVRQTFTQSFDLTRFRTFVLELLNDFDASKAFTANKTYIKDAFKPHVERFERLGTYTSPDEEKLDVLVVYLTADSKLERARTAIRNFVADHLKQRDGKDAALVAFVSPIEKQWRFSYVKMEYATVEKGSGKVGVETRLTPARRFSYIVGEGESCHTAQTRFLDLLEETEHRPTLAKIEDAFSVDAVTKEFFKKYAELFEEIKAALDKLARKDAAISKEFEKKNVRAADFAKKLMGQVVFLYFIQKKGWLGVENGKGWGTGPHDFLRRLAGGGYGNYENFFNDVLEPLFYDTLATDRGRDAWCNAFNCRIPFLNGGLFEPLADYNWRTTDITLPNRLFTNAERFDDFSTGTGLLDMFDRYNFTVNEAEPLEKEVAIDPEMLGKVFENLIEENLRKGLGSYYTPREIVHYMCQESLINYLDTALNTSTETIGRERRKQAEFGDENAEQSLLTAPARSEIVARADIKTFIHLGDQISHYEAVETRYAIKMPKSIEKNAGLIDNKLADVTICDPAVGSGAFPVGMMTEIVRARAALTPYLKGLPNRTAYDFKRDAIQNCLYGVDIDLGAVEIAKLRLWLSLVVDEEDVKQIKPLPNLSYKIVTGNSLLGVEKTLFNEKVFKQLEQLKKAYFGEPDREKKHQYKRQIDEAIHVLTSGKHLFDFEIFFSEVLHTRGGFDVVIANPPYVGEKGHKSMFEKIRASSLGVRFGAGKMDFFYYFIHLALDLLRQNGSAAFITTSYYVTATGARKLIADLNSRSTIRQLLNLGELKIFESALGQHNMISIFKRGRSSEDAEIITTSRRGNLEADTFNAIVSRSDAASRYNNVAQSALFVDGRIQLNHDASDRILDRVKTQHRSLGEAVAISQGLQSGLDDCFILTSSSPLFRSRFAKRYYKNSDIYAFGYVPSKLRVLYIDNDNKKEAFVDVEVREHLQQFKAALARRAQIIRSGQDWYSMLWPRRREYFESEKVVCSYRTLTNQFALVNGDWFCGTDVYMMMSKSSECPNELLVAILNSAFVAAWLQRRGARKGAMLELTKDHLSNIPLPRSVSSAARQDIKKIVKCIVAESPNGGSHALTRLRSDLDEIVYALYGVTYREIQIVEGAGSKGHSAAA